MKKVYLKDLKPDEVIRRLKAGEVVKDEKSKEIIKMIEGILSFISPLGNIRLNIILNPLCPDYYFEEPEKLKIEVGKCYKTRDGRKAFICYNDEKEDYFWGSIQADIGGTRWKENGLWIRSEENDIDLISEWSDDDVAKN